MKSSILAITIGAAGLPAAVGALALPLWMVGCSAEADEAGEATGDNAVTLILPAPSEQEAAQSAATEGETEKLCDATRVAKPNGTDGWVSTKVVHSGNWGDWGCADWCPPDSFVYTFNLRTEFPQGGGDDTSVNAISGWCFNRFNGSHTGFVTSAEGGFGSWLSLGTPPIMCSNASLPVAGVNLKVEGNQGSGGDDTSANSLKFACLGSPGTELEVGHNTTWGSWGGQVLCPGGTAVCGIQTRLEGDQGSGDDTALNGLKVFCCTL